MPAGDYPVIVVGGGPVGLALALELGWRGVGTLLVEQTDGAVAQARQDLVGIRTMEFCRRWGIVRDVEMAGYPRDQKQDIVYVTSVTGYELGRELRPAMAEETPPPFSPQKRERCPQNFFDPVLRRAAGRHDCVELRYHARFVGQRQADDHVAVTLEDTATKERYQVACRYLVGCDGGSSAVRDSLGISLQGEPVLANATNVLISTPDLIDLSGKAAAYRYVLLDGSGLWATMVAIDGRQTWRLQIVGSSDAPFLSEDAVHAALRKAVGREFPYELRSVLHWRRRELVAARFRQGRVFLVGDAAQQMSPTGAFGMNTGIGEAVDLAWKLEAALAGWGGEQLLDSYEAERRPVAVRNVREAADNFRRMQAIKGDPAITEPGSRGDAARHALGMAVSQVMSREWNAIGIHIGYRYDTSPICWPDGTVAPPDAVTSYEPTARPGARAPHLWIDDNVSTLDLFGRGFVLLCLGGDAERAAPLAEAAAARGVPLRVIAMDDPRMRSLYQATFVLVRPDGHVCWRDNTIGLDPLEIVDVVRGARRAPTVDARERLSL